MEPSIARTSLLVVGACLLLTLGSNSRVGDCQQYAAQQLQPSKVRQAAQYSPPPTQTGARRSSSSASLMSLAASQAASYAPLAITAAAMNYTSHIGWHQPLQQQQQAQHLTPQQSLYQKQRAAYQLQHSALLQHQHALHPQHQQQYQAQQAQYQHAQQQQQQQQLEHLQQPLLSFQRQQLAELDSAYKQRPAEHSFIAQQPTQLHASAADDGSAAVVGYQQLQPAKAPAEAYQQPQQAPVEPQSAQYQQQQQAPELQASYQQPQDESYEADETPISAKQWPLNAFERTQPQLHNFHQKQRQAANSRQNHEQQQQYLQQQQPTRKSYRQKQHSNNSGYKNYATRSYGAFSPRADPENCPMRGALTVCDAIGEYPSEMIFDKVKAAKYANSELFDLTTLFSDEREFSSEPFDARRKRRKTPAGHTKTSTKTSAPYEQQQQHQEEQQYQQPQQADCSSTAVEQLPQLYYSQAAAANESAYSVEASDDGGGGDMSNAESAVSTLSALSLLQQQQQQRRRTKRQTGDDVTAALAGAARAVAGGVEPDSSDAELQTRVPVCASNSIFISPRAALNDKRQWKYVVNAPERDPKIKQIVKVDICANAFGPCNEQVSVPFGFVSQCKQKYSKKKLLSVNAQTGQLDVDTFFIPSCCVCQLVRRLAPLTSPLASDDANDLFATTAAPARVAPAARKPPPAPTTPAAADTPTEATLAADDAGGANDDGFGTGAIGGAEGVAEGGNRIARALNRAANNNRPIDGGMPRASSTAAPPTTTAKAPTTPKKKKATAPPHKKVTSRKPTTRATN